MATVTNVPVQESVNVGSAMGYALAPLMWVFKNFFFIGILVILGVIVAFVFIMYYMKNEDKKEQEDMLYREYKNTVRTIKKNQDERMYTKKYSRFNFMLLGLPIFHYKVGRKIYDKRSRFVGYYDGMFTDMLGNHNLLLWKDKSFGFLKNNFVLRLPTKQMIVKKESELTKVKEKDRGLKYNIGEEKFYMQWMVLGNDFVKFNEADKTITVKMLNYVKNDYYYYPLYEDDNGKTLDLTENINATNQINSSNNLLTEVIKESGKNVIGMAKTNTQLVYEQRQPEKVKEIESD